MLFSPFESKVPMIIDNVDRILANAVSQIWQRQEVDRKDYFFSAFFEQSRSVAKNV